MSGAVARIAKPVLRNHLHNDIKGMIIKGTVLSIITTALAYQFYLVPRRAKVVEFYKNYDPKADMERMRKNGIFEIKTKDDE